MISKSIIEKLREIYQSLPKVELIDKGDGWVNQYDLLRAVGKVGINYLISATLLYKNNLKQ